MKKEDLTHPNKPKQKKKREIIILIGLLTLIIVFIIFDPFRIIARLQNKADPISRYVPADTPIYINFDLLQAASKDTKEIISAFQDGAEDALESSEDMTNQLNERLEEIINLSFSEDVEPWIGQFVAIGVSGLVFNDFGEMVGLDFRIVVEARSRGQADEFVEKFVTNYEEINEIHFEVQEYKDVLIYEYQSGQPGEGLAIGRCKGYLFFSSDSQNIMTSIDLKTSDSLWKDPDYRSLKKHLPGNRLMTIFLNGEKYIDIFSSLAGRIGNPTLAPTGQAEKMVVTVSVHDYGVAASFAVFQEQENLSEIQQALISSRNFKPQTDSMVPEDTLVYIVGNRMDLALDQYLESENEYVDDFKDSLEFYNEEIDIDILSLFDAFDGEFAICIAPSMDGLFYDLSDGEVQLGFEFLIGTSKENVVLDIMRSFITVASRNPSLKITESYFGDLTLFDFNIQEGVSVISFLTYGAGANYAVISTSQDIAENSFDGGLSLSDNPLYKKALEIYPDGNSPTIFIDLQGVFEYVEFLLDDTAEDDFHEVVDKLGPISVLAGGVEVVDRVNIATFVLFIDTE